MVNVFFLKIGMSLRALREHAKSMLFFTFKLTYHVCKFFFWNRYYANTPVKAVINAVYVIANIIQNMIEDVCSEEKMAKMGKTECLIDTEKDTDRMNR